MDGFDILSIICSILGAVIFIYAIVYEFKIIKQLKKIKKPRSWQLVTVFTIFFTLGYVINIVGIILAENIPIWGEIREVLNALVFLFGGVFVAVVILISHKTYGLIFEAAERE